MNENGVCRLCLEVILDNDFKKLAGATGKMLQCVPLTLDASITKDPLVCSACIKNLQMLFEFKTSCLSNNNYLKTYVRSYDAVKLNLEKLLGGKAELDVSDKEENICRFCFGYFERNSFVVLNNLEQDVFLKDMLDKCLSEIDLNITENPLMCKDCMESLENQFNFMMSCLDNEAKISYFLSFGKRDNLNNILEHVKRLENDNAAAESSKITLDRFTNTVGEKPEDVQVVLVKDETIKQGHQELAPASASLNDLHKDPSAVSLYKCNRCDYSTRRKSDMKKHYLTHDNPAPPYTCHVCSLVVKNKADLQSRYAAHAILHENPSTKSLHKCDYSTKCKGDLKKHRLKHDNPAPAYKCHVCSLVVKSKADLQSHHGTHFKPKTSTEYKCKECNYAATEKLTLKRHYKVRHKKDVEIDILSI